MKLGGGRGGVASLAGGILRPRKVSHSSPPGRLRCVVSGKLRKDTPEENVRQRIARSLLDEYGYAREDIELESAVRLGHTRKRVDIAIYPHGEEQLRESILIII